jgi:hypothetical protein
MRVEIFRQYDDLNNVVSWTARYTGDHGVIVEGMGLTEKDALLNGMITASDRIAELEDRLADPMTYADLTER